MALVTSAAFVKATAVFAIGLFVGIVGLAGEQTLGRLTARDVHALNRLAYYRTTWDAIWDRPLLGTGYGTYADAFKAYNHPGTGTYFLDKAHNTYLQVIMELGWPAAAALYSGLALLVFRCLQERVHGSKRALSRRARRLLGAGRRSTRWSISAWRCRPMPPPTPCFSAQGARRLAADRRAARCRPLSQPRHHAIPS